jgi:hypothetical protein
MEGLFNDQFIKALNKRLDLWDLEPIKGKTEFFKFRFVSDATFEIFDERYTIENDSDIIQTFRYM